MKIFFITNGLQRTAGTERVIVQLANELNYDITICVPGTDEVAFSGYEGLNIVSCGVGEFPEGSRLGKITHRIQYYQALKKIIKKGSTLFSFSFDLNVLTTMLGGRYKCKVIACEHIEYGYHRGIRAIVRRHFYKKKCVTVVCLTETDRARYAKDNIHVICIPNFIYLENSTYNASSKIILSIGRLVYQKNFSLLIKSFKHSQLHTMGWSLVIVGEGEEYNLLNSLINDLGLNECISIHKFTKDINSYYKKASLFCMTSRFEAFPMVLLEAMNHALPVLVTDFPTGAREILGVHSEQIVENNNAEIFADGLKQVCLNEESRKEQSIKNRQYVINYSKDNIISMWEDVIESSL